LWVEPNHMQRGMVDIRSGDIIANLAHDPRCSLWFDHHASHRVDVHFEGVFRLAPSAAGLVFDYFRPRLSRDFQDLVAAADKIDAADLSMDEVLHPERHPYVMLSDTVSGQDPADEAYWNRLVAALRRHEITTVLADGTVAARCRRAVTENREYRSILQTHTRQIGRVSITDLRGFDQAPSGNRFLVFSLFPQTEVNVKVRLDRRDRDKIIVSIGHSIFKRTCTVDAGALCARFGGGGHHGAGSCSFPRERTETHLSQILAALTEADATESGD